MRPLWQALYDAGADVVLTGHDHDYERFAPHGPAAAATPRRLREFVVGTGGKTTSARAGSPTARSATTSTFGVLKLTLRPGGYLWDYVAEAVGRSTTPARTPVTDVPVLRVGMPRAPHGVYAGRGNSSRIYLHRFLERAGQAVQPAHLVLDAGSGRAPIGTCSLTLATRRRTSSP